MDADGCIVIWGRYKRQYGWDDFQIKAVASFSSGIFQKNTYTKAAIFFCKPKIHKVVMWNPIDYSWIVHPLTFIFINFPPPKRWSDRKVYEIDEEIFMSKMKEWDVELEEINFHKNVL